MQPPEQTGRTFRNTAIWTVAGLLLMALAIAALSARPVWRSIKAQRAERLSHEAAALLESRRPDAGRVSDNLQRAWDLAPDNPVVKRTWAEMLIRQNSRLSAARQLLQQLIDSGDASPDDLVNLAVLHLRTGEVAEAEQIHRSLPPSAADSPRAHELDAHISLARGNIPQAFDSWRKFALSATDDSPLAPANLVVLDMVMPSGDVAGPARDDLLEIAAGEDRLALIILERLAGADSLEPDETQRLIDLLEQHPLARERHRFLGLSLQLRLEPATRHRVLARELAAHDGIPLQRSHELMGWLLREGEAELVLRLLPFEEARHHPRLTQVFLQALREEERWRRLETVLNDPGPLAVPESERALLQAESMAGLDASPADIAERLRHVYRLATDERDDRLIFRAASLSEDAGLPALAREGFDLLATRPDLRMVALPGLFRAAATEGRTGEMLRIAKLILADLPRLEQFRETVAYLRLLTGYQMELALVDIEDLGASERRSDSRLFLLAFAHHRFGDTAAAVAKLTPVDLARLPPGQRAVAAWILAEGGDPAGAMRLVDRLDSAALLPEEADLLARVEQGRGQP